MLLQRRKVCTLTEAACQMWQPETFRERINGRPLSRRALYAKVLNDHSALPSHASRHAAFQVESVDLTLFKP